MAYLVLVRHGESLWNAQGLWTGLRDIGLSEKGKKEAQDAGLAIKDIPFNVAFTSNLKRAQDTLKEIKAVTNNFDLPTFKDAALNERDYGDYTGKNKWDLKTQLGDETFVRIRRSWNEPIPNGESLKDVYNRVIPYYEQHILPYIKNDENVLIAAHGNSLRALVKYLDKISDENIASVEIATGEILLYTMDQQGNVILKEKRAAGSKPQ